MNSDSKDFLIGMVVMIAIILLVIVLGSSQWSPTTGNAPASGVQGCAGGDASGAGC